MKTSILSESIDLTEAQLDSDERVIKGVVLIRAGMSKNRRYYGEDVLKAAAPIFEAAKAYANHPSKAETKDRPERSIRDITGFYKNVIFENGAVRADRYFTRNQAGQDAWALAEDIISGRAPASLAGLSINAVGTGKVDKFEDGEALRVESITGALSIDDVSQPAAAGSYVFTASNGDELTTQLIASLSFEEWFESHPEYTERLKKEWKTVRLEETTKQALADADQKVKAAQAEAGQAQQALSEAQTEVKTLTEANAMLAEANTLLRRKLAIEEALRGAGLPAVYANDLRERLPQMPPDKWQEAIETERSKAKRAGATAKVPVTGAGVREVVGQPVIAMSESLEPLPHEDIRTWQERISRIKSNKR
jgi:arsenate reductase-like glutaredoxin family protein